MKAKKTKAEYIKAIHQAGSHSVSRFGGTWGGGSLLQQVPDELAWLYGKLAERGIGYYCEIGVASGGFVRLLYEQIGFDHAWLLDDGKHPHSARRAKHIANVPHTLFIGDSHSPEACDFLQEVGDTKFDTVLVDGDHTQKGVEQDIDLVLRHCVPGTWLILHDSVFMRTKCAPGQRIHVPLVVKKIRNGGDPRLAAVDEYASTTYRRPLGIFIAKVQ